MVSISLTHAWYQSLLWQRFQKCIGIGIADGEMAVPRTDCCTELRHAVHIPSSS